MEVLWQIGNSFPIVEEAICGSDIGEAKQVYIRMATFSTGTHKLVTKGNLVKHLHLGHNHLGLKDAR